MKSSRKKLVRIPSFFLSIALLCLLLFSCKSHYQVDIPSYLFKDIVDSTFVLRLEIDGVEREFHQRDQASASEIPLGDSLAVLYNFTFTDTLENSRVETFYISISKIFQKNQLSSVYISNGDTIATGSLNPEEYLSVFPLEDIGFITYDYSKDRFSTSDYAGGALFVYDNGFQWKTDYSFKHLDSLEFSEAYSNSSCEIINVYSYTQQTIYVEVEFNVIIHDWYTGDPKEFSNGYFKGYLWNILR